jgi:dTMP kinase
MAHLPRTTRNWAFPLFFFRRNADSAGRAAETTSGRRTTQTSSSIHRSGRSTILVLLGIDGAGKTSAAGALKELIAPATPVLVLGNYSGRKSIAGWQQRYGVQLPLPVIDAAETAVRIINIFINHAKASRFEGLVIMDRYLYCQLALREARGLGKSRLLTTLLKHLPKPQAVVYFDITAEQAHERIELRGTDHETVQALLAYRQGYKNLPDYPSFTTINAGGSPFGVIEQLQHIIDRSGLTPPVQALDSISGFGRREPRRPVAA